MEKKFYEVPKKILLIIAGIVWMIAGFNVARLGFISYQKISINWYHPVLSLVIFILFGMMFYKMTKKHSCRIKNYEKEYYPFWYFFDLKAYIIMAIMMGGGIGLREAKVFPDVFVAFFYTGLGLALFLAGILFIYEFISYGRQIKEKEDKVINNSEEKSTEEIQEDSVDKVVSEKNDEATEKTIIEISGGEGQDKKETDTESSKETGESEADDESSEGAGESEEEANNSKEGEESTEEADANSEGDALAEVDALDEDGAVEQEEDVDPEEKSTLDFIEDSLIDFDDIKSDDKKSSEGGDVNDDSDVPLRYKAWALAGYMFIVVIGIAAFVSMILTKTQYLYIFSITVCILILLYLVSYLGLKKKSKDVK